MLSWSRRAWKHKRRQDQINRGSGGYCRMKSGKCFATTMNNMRARRTTLRPPAEATRIACGSHELRDTPKNPPFATGDCPSLRYPSALQCTSPPALTATESSHLTHLSSRKFMNEMKSSRAAYKSWKRTWHEIQRICTPEFELANP